MTDNKKKAPGAPPKAKLDFSIRLVMGIAGLSLLGMVAALSVAGVMARDGMQAGAIGMASRDQAIYAGEIDAWLGAAARTVYTLAIALEALPDGESFQRIAETLLARHDFLENVFIGFSDGRVINGAGWQAPEGWLGTDRPWYRAAREAGEGRVAITDPYVSHASGNIAVAMAVLSPDLGGIGAAVGAAISMEAILARISERPAPGGGRAILASMDGRVIAHSGYRAGPEAWERSLLDAPGGGLILSAIASGEMAGSFDDPELGRARFLAAPLASADWALIAVFPADAARSPALRGLAAAGGALAALLAGLFVFAAFFAAYVAKSIEERRGSEERLGIIIDNMPMVSNISGRDSRIIECNEEALRLFGLRDKREYMDRFFELQPEFQPDGQNSMEKARAMEDIAFEAGQNRFEWMHRRMDGEPLPCEVTLARVKWNGEDQLLSFVRDLREFHEAQRRERRIHERMRLMLDATPLIIEFWDNSLGFVDCNKTALDFYGFQTKEAYRDRMRGGIPGFQPGGEPSAGEWKRRLGSIAEGGCDRFEFRSVKRGGQRVSLEVVGYRAMFGGEQVIVTCGKDVTQLKETEERMREAEERLQLMLDGAPISCYLIDKDFRAIDCNRETLNLFDFAGKAEGIEKFREIFSRYRSDKLRSHFDRAIRNGQERFEWVLQKPSEGGYIPCEIAFVRFSHRGEDVVAAYIFDQRVLKEMLWERRRVESAEEHSRAKSRFLARMSREIRTPVTAILDISEIQLQDRALPPGAAAAFGKIQGSAGMLLQIVGDILDLSQIEAGSLAIEEAEYDVAAMIREAAQARPESPGGGKVEFRASVDERLPAFLIGDEPRVRQIIGSLLSNAFSHTSSGSVELSVQREPRLEEGGITLFVGIRDTGRGMTPEQIDELYSERASLSGRESPYSGGAGLGMPIACSLARMMGAQISVESEPGKGTSVAARIPQKAAGPAALGKAARKICDEIARGRA